MGTITVDPITRIEGHLKAEVTTDGSGDGSGNVTNVKVSGTMARGVENLLLGKDPRDATYVTERICGVCFGAHGWTSCLAVETAHGTTELPEAARLLRNLLVGACWLHDHVLHFYHLSALDYLNLTALLTYPDDGDPYIVKIRDLAQAEINNTPIEGEYAGPLLPHYLPYDAFCINNTDIVATAVQHYLDALVMQVKAKKMSALFSGKQPHQSGMIVGGVTELPSKEKRDLFGSMLEEQCEFINTVYKADVLLVANWLLDNGLPADFGAGYQNFLSYGGFPEADESFLYPEGAIVGGNLVASDRATIEAGLSEDVTNSKYTSAGGGHPSQSTQIFDLSKEYSFVKAPRYIYQDTKYPMEVGPIARMMVAMMRGISDPTGALATFTSLYDLGVRGVLLRHAARMLETLMLCDAMVRWLGELEDLIDGGGHGGMHDGVQIHDTDHWDPPATGQAYGMTEAPRGALAHWVKIDDYKIGHYACVVPTTWNASPTDAGGNKGPYEKALMSLSGMATPLNIVRTIRSFDPCIACAVHLIKPNGDVEKFTIDI